MIEQTTKIENKIANMTDPDAKAKCKEIQDHANVNKKKIFNF